MVFFVKSVCEWVSLQQCEAKCVNLTVSYLEFKYFSARNLLFVNNT